MYGKHDPDCHNCRGYSALCFAFCKSSRRLLVDFCGRLDQHNQATYTRSHLWTLRHSVRMWVQVGQNMIGNRCGGKPQATIWQRSDVSSGTPQCETYARCWTTESLFVPHSDLIARVREAQHTGRACKRHDLSIARASHVALADIPTR
jgi:hypothetical protein